jgi:hypothetical protein
VITERKSQDLSSAADRFIDWLTEGTASLKDALQSLSQDLTKAFLAPFRQGFEDVIYDIAGKIRGGLLSLFGEQAAAPTNPLARADQALSLAGSRLEGAGTNLAGAGTGLTGAGTGLNVAATALQAAATGLGRPSTGGGARTLGSDLTDWFTHEEIGEMLGLEDTRKVIGNTLGQNIDDWFTDEEISDMLGTTVAKASSKWTDLAMAGIGVLMTGIQSLFTSTKASVESLGDSAKQAVQSTQASRGLVAGDTNIAVSELSDQLERALRGTNSLLRQILQVLRQQSGQPAAAVGATGYGGYSIAIETLSSSRV